MNGDPRVGQLIAELQEQVEERAEEQELAGRVLRKMLKETLYEAKLARAEVAQLRAQLEELEANATSKHFAAMAEVSLVNAALESVDERLDALEPPPSPCKQCLMMLHGKCMYCGRIAEGAKQ